MPTNYLPRPDGDFAAFADHYYGAVKKWWDAQGLDPTDLKPLETALAEWDKDYPAHVKAQAAAEGARQAKDAARKALEREIRPITNFIQGYTKTTDADRATIGITVRQPTGGASPAPTSRPLVRVDTSLRLRHTIRFSDEATPTRRARPKNTLGAEVRLKLLPPHEPAPTDPEALRFLTLATSGIATAEFPSQDGGKTAVYMLRWVGPRGAVGPWSEICSATVAA
jgi:hypothetical protein